MVFTTGSDLAVYRILDTIGKGGMGEVYRARKFFFFLEHANAEHVLEGLRKAGLTLEAGP